MKTYTFIDASNIIYGTRDEGWRVDFKKLYKYLKERYECDKIYYFAGEDQKNIPQQKFYRLLTKIGYDLILKPVKLYKQEDGRVIKKANCDVDLTFYTMRDKNLFKRGIFLTGDGDFEVLFKYFLLQKKKIIVIANGKRTAKEIRQLIGPNFSPMKSLRSVLEYTNKSG